jgi:exonuclease III
MAVLMFWNTGRTATGTAIGQLCRAHDVDILLLAEAEIPSARLTTEINEVTGPTRTLWELPRLESRVRAFTRYPPGSLKPAFDDGHVKMLELRPPVGVPLLIVAVHLPSKLRAHDEDQAYRVRRLRQDIVAQEAQRGHRNTVIIGDLNLNPFEDALTAADGLQGVMDRHVATRSVRVVQGREWDYFYNPMWSRLGDASPGPPGTYWRAGSGLVNHFWNTFDQVLLRPALLPFYQPEQLLVPDHVDAQPILNSAGSGGGLSDHLPVVVTLFIERETGYG